MANIQKLAQRLKEFEDGQRSSEFAKLLWKPKEGPQTIRIVPYKFNPDTPFIELMFYYNIGGKAYLAPSTFGKPDPILETIEALRSNGSSEEREIAAKLSPNTRTYAPIIVRGEEELGVRFWGFGVQVYKQLLKLMTNPKYGDISSLSEGRDIDVEFHKISNKKNVKTGQAFPETTIMADPNVTPAVNPARKDLMSKLQDQTDILKIFPLKSYEELKDIIDKWLNPEMDVAGDNTDPTPQSVTNTPAAASAPTSKASTGPAGEALANQFEDFFKKPTS